MRQSSFVKKNRSGYALLAVTVLLGAVGSAMVIMALARSVDGFRARHIAEDGARARAAADACVELALSRIALGEADAGTVNVDITDMESAACFANIEKEDDVRYAVSATGEAASSVAHIRLVAEQSAEKIRVISFTFASP